MDILSSDIMDEIFLFLNIVDYLCNVMLVCKEWNIENIHDLIAINKTHFIRKLIYNSCKGTLRYLNHHDSKNKYLLTPFDLIHEYELRATFSTFTVPPVTRNSQVREGLVLGSREFDTSPDTIA
eukprot:UN05169